MAEPTVAPVPARRDTPKSGLAWPVRWALLTMIGAVFLSLALAVLSPVALYVIDVIWIKYVAAPAVQVLEVDPKEEQQKQQEKAQW